MNLKYQTYQITKVVLPSRKCPLASINIANHILTAKLVFALALGTLGGVEASAQCIGCTLPTFAPAQVYSGSVGAVAAGDFNNDGKADLVEQEGESNIKIVFGDGLGGFGAPVFISLRPDFYAMPGIATSDFNRDGNLDVILNGAGFLVLYGDGTGHIESDFLFSNDIFMFSLSVGDFNNDDNPDVVFTGLGQISVHLGDGLGFNRSYFENYTVTPNPYSPIPTADFNGDGNLDFITPNMNIYFGEGAGDFTIVPIVGVSPSANFVVADIDGDGEPDVVTGSSSEDPHFWGINVFMGNGTENFAFAGFHQVDPSRGDERLMRLSDMNGDGKLDLVVSNGNHSISVVCGDGNGSFGSPTEFPVGMTNPAWLALGDFNADAKPDIATAETVLLNSTFQTAIGPNSSVIVNNTTLTFGHVTAGGTTTLTSIDPATVGQVPGGFAVSNSVAYEIATTASFTGSVTLAFKVPAPISETDFNTLAILHNENGTLVDVAASTPARDYANLTLYATTTSLSPFYLARRGSHIKTLYDQTKAHKSGSTIPIKLQLLNSAEVNISSSSTPLAVRDIKLMSGNTSAPVVDSGNANPDYTFRHDTTLGGASGGYVFNISTKGLAPGLYVLSFYVGNDRSFFYTLKFEVK